MVKIKGFLLTLATACMFGLGAVLGKMASSVLNPLLVTFLNFAVGGGLLLIFLLVRRIALFKHLERRDWLNLLLLVVFGTTLPACCVLYGLALTSAIKAGFLMQMQGISSVLFAVLFLRERLNWKQVGGMLLLLLGSLFVVMKTTQTSILSAFNLGDVLVILGAIGFGYAILPAKALTGKIDSLPLTVWKLLLSALMILPFLSFQPTAWPTYLPPFLLWLLPIYIISNFCIGYVTQQEGLKYLQAWESATTMQSTPIFSTLFAMLLLGDSLSPLQLVGGIIVLAGGCVIALGGANLSRKPLTRTSQVAPTGQEM
ncbi:DMT family transporter [Ktedonobacter racemifer]|uniref:EamA domain-containing protein n=1 Tax=Ktedonobacter racemifer DSM 44963 TaxID=485913 RepID=D6TYY9_KTERA|nr:DMT family transporter [Ktedonobacter racemifer]EFH81779.1 protein of unknown function DUF6 transmembrane [Ktedonobacter racemifer DSM 44963]